LHRKKIEEHPNTSQDIGVRTIAVGKANAKTFNIQVTMEKNLPHGKVEVERGDSEHSTTALDFI
jgi:hypothetical protein